MPTAFDTETYLIRPGLPAPQLVCASFCDGDEPVLFHRSESYEIFRALLEGGDLIIGHNVAFDLLVVATQWPDLLPLIFKAYREDRVTCTMVREKLTKIAAGVAYKYVAKGSYTLAAVAKRRIGLDLEKDDWRLRYGELDSISMSEWPEGALLYALGDGYATFHVWKKQEVLASQLADQYRQSRAAWWLQLMSANGMRTDPVETKKFADNLQTKYEQLGTELKAMGVVREDGSRDTKKAAELARLYSSMGLTKKLELTAKSKVSLSKDSCHKIGFSSYSDYSSLSKQLSTDVPLLLRGIEEPIHPYFDVLKETGRTGSSPNVQNLPRYGGMRECFVPRPGYRFAAADYSQMELRTVAQVCISMKWKSALGDALNAGIDPHLQMAALILRISYEEALRRKELGDREIDDARQSSKVANFGFPGGLGASRFVDFARDNYGVIVTEEEAHKLKAFWLKAWPEFKRDYFPWVGAICNSDRPQIKHIYSDRLRGDVTYTEACNSFFQGLAADAAKAAGFLIAEACYLDKKSPLYGCRLWNFVHDEFILEAPEDRAAEAAEELARLMVKGALPFMPDVPPVVEPWIGYRWSKKAKSVRDTTGRLVPWDAPKEAA